MAVTAAPQAVGGDDGHRERGAARERGGADLAVPFLFFI
jgi:hypothetical protein